MRVLAGRVSLLVLLALPGCLLKLPQTGGLAAGGDADVVQSADGVIPFSPDGSPISDTGSEGLADFNWNPPPTWDSWGIPDTAPPGDFGAGEGVDTAVPQQTWSCYYPVEEVASEPLTSSFVVEDLDIGMDDLLYVYGFLCGLDQTTSAVPERYFPIQIDSPTELVAALFCSKPCYLFLMKNGCLYDSMVGCWYTGENTVQAEASLMPGLYLLGVEFPAPADIPFDPTGLVFDLHAGLNQAYGQTPCQVEESVEDSQIPSACKVSGGEAAKTAMVHSALSWSAGDDFDLHCTQGGVAADEVGGMPDRVHAYTADFEDPLPRLVDVTVKFQLPPGSDTSAGHILAVTTSPCGAAQAVVACTWGHETELSLSGVSVFPHETLYAVVDGMGEEAFGVAWQGEYELSWTVHETCY